jgi:hypothetical protein
MNWYVKGADGKVFGPADDEKMLSWVKEGRIDPFAGVSNDLKQWKLASLVPMFEMDWIVENAPGSFYGPTHRNVIDDLIKAESLSPTCRIYQDYHDGAVEKAAEASRAAAEKAMVEVQTEAERAMAEVQADAERVLASKDSEITALKSELEQMKAKDVEIAALKSELEQAKSMAAESAARMCELEDKFASLSVAKKREWKMEVVEPEIVAEEPPSSVREIFKPGKAQILADLERQAQAELARMGASGAKKFFGFK